MNIMALGTCCVDVYPQKGVVTPGGEALNIAAQLSLRGDVNAHLMGLLGRDSYADAILDRLAPFEINCTALRKVEGETASHVIHIDDDGDRYFKPGAWRGGVSGDLALTTEDRARLGQMDAVLTTHWQSTLPELIALKSEAGFLLAVDFNEQRDFTAWESQIPHINILFLSAEDALREPFLERSRSTDTIYVLTFAERGSAAFHHGKVIHCPAEEVGQVIDTTGCGDCYQAHFVAEYLRTGEILSAMERASGEAARVTQYVGGVPPLV